VFLWAPGDGSDFFDGGEGIDTLVVGLAGEVVNGQLVFQPSGNQQAGEVFIDPTTGLPRMDVTTSPGFCEVIDGATTATSAAELAALDLHHLVRFFARGAANSFAAGTQTTDNGLRVTIHMRNVEVLVCTNRAGGVIEAFNLTVSPPQPLALPAVTGRLPLVGAIVQ